jgi:hypothetical protein
LDSRADSETSDLLGMEFQQFKPGWRSIGLLVAGWLWNFFFA